MLLAFSCYAQADDVICLSLDCRVLIAAPSQAQIVAVIAGRVDGVYLAEDAEAARLAPDVDVNLLRSTENACDASVSAGCSGSVLAVPLRDDFAATFSLRNDSGASHTPHIITALHVVLGVRTVKDATHNAHVDKTRVILRKWRGSNGNVASRSGRRRPARDVNSADTVEWHPPVSRLVFFQSLHCSFAQFM